MPNIAKVPGRGIYFNFLEMQSGEARSPRPMPKKQARLCSRFDTIPAYDRHRHCQTDTQIDTVAGPQQIQGRASKSS